jgi:hypothetical protein
LPFFGASGTGLLVSPSGLATRRGRNPNDAAGAANAANPPPLVTIQTRVVGTGSNPYSTQVGNGPLAPPTTYTATGAGPGYHVVALNRATLALVVNNTYGLDFNSLNSMSNDVTGLGSGVLVIISSIGPPTSIASQAISFLNNVAANVGGAGPRFMYSAGSPRSPAAYSLIGITGAPAPPTQVSTYADPDTSGNISGALVLDIQSNYAFVWSKFVTIQTMTGPQQDTIMIGNKAFEAPPLPAGTGGFHLLVLKRTTIDRIATDPKVVVLHTSYATNSDHSTSDSETARMASDLTLLPTDPSSNLLFIIASLGRNPGFNINSSAALANYITIEDAIGHLGGSGNLDALLDNGYYSLIGVPGFADPTAAPEVRSYATPQLSGNITAVMQQNAFGVFTPVSFSAFPPNASLDLSLYSTALAAPTKWPVAPRGSGACPPAPRNAPPINGSAGK